jgi:hypothetical protein
MVTQHLVGESCCLKPHLSHGIVGPLLFSVVDLCPFSVLTALVFSLVPSQSFPSVVSGHVLCPSEAFFLLIKHMRSSCMDRKKEALVNFSCLQNSFVHLKWINNSRTFTAGQKQKVIFYIELIDASNACKLSKWIHLLFK